MIAIVGPRAPHAAGLARSWEDARGYYSALDPDVFRPPDPEDGELAGWLLNDLVAAAAEADRFVGVADRAGEALGFVMACVQQPRVAAERELVRDEALVRGAIEVLVVQRAHWGGGIGRALMEAAEEWAAARGAALVRLTTYEASPAAVPFYEALGYDRRAIVFLKYL